MKLLSVTITAFFCLFLLAAVTRHSSAPVTGDKELVVDEEKILLDSTEIGLTTVISGLNVPWDMEWLSTNELMFTELDGRVSRLNLATGQRKALLQLRNVWVKRTAGLLGMAVQQRKKDSTYVLLNYTRMIDSLIYNTLVRYRYHHDTLTDALTLLSYQSTASHNGSRLTVTGNGKILWATGDGYKGDIAQQPDSVQGKILRLNMDGSVPADNPVPGSLVYAYGFRNMQGLVAAANGNIYTSEHGEATDDEVNRIVARKNYGWPKVEGYCNTDKEKEFCKLNAVTEPMTAWTPTIAPAGIDYYNHPSIPEWRNALLLTTLKANDFRVLTLSKDGKRIVGEKVYLQKKLGRMRDVCVAKNGDIYLSTSNRDWNPSPGFPLPNDDRIIRIRKIRTVRNRAAVVATAVQKAPAANAGAQLYIQYCASCHREDGKGLQGSFPALAGSAVVGGDAGPLISLVLKGRSGAVTIRGTVYDQPMPSFAFMPDQELATLLSHVRKTFGATAGAVSAAQVSTVRRSK